MHVKWVSTLLVALIAATTSISIAVAADTGPPPADPAAPGQPAATSGEPSKPGDAPPPSVTIIGAKEAHAVLGRDVRSTSGEDMGRIVDIIVDKGGAVRAAVIDFHNGKEDLVSMDDELPVRRGGVEFLVILNGHFY